MANSANPPHPLPGRSPAEFGTEASASRFSRDGRWLATGHPRGLLLWDPETARIVAVEPAESPVLSGGAPGPHKIQGLGAGFIPEILDGSLIDEVMTVTLGESGAAARLLAREEGCLLYPSDAADARSRVVLGGGRLLNTKKTDEP